MPLHALARAGLAVTLLLGLVGTAHALTLKSEEFKTHRITNAPRSKTVSSATTAAKTALSTPR